MRRYLIPMGICLALSGCGLLKVPESFHEAEVVRLNLFGSDLEAAKQKAIRSGFECADEMRRGGKLVVECNKRSPDLLCPQRRFVYIGADPASRKVISVSTRVVDNFCLGAG